MCRGTIWRALPLSGDSWPARQAKLGRNPRRCASALLVLAVAMAADHAPLLDGESGVVPISVATPEKHYALLRAPSGRYLASGGDDGGLRLAHWAEDAALWSEAISTSSSVFTNLVSGATVSGSLDAGVCEDAGSEPDHGRAFQLRSDGAVLGDDGTADGGWGAVFLAQHGPAHAPSEYLRQIREEGWVCMPAICPPEILKKLQELAEESVTPEQRRERMDRGSQQQPFLRSSAIAKLATDPTVMWVLRQYLRTPAVR